MKRVLVACLLAAITGCARFPAGPIAPSDTLLIFRMVVAGKVRSGEEEGSGGTPYIYMVALRPSEDPNPIEQGPIPVIAPPWGNGFVAGAVTHFVWWNPQMFPRYALFQFRDALLNEYLHIATPIRYGDVPNGGQVIEFTLNLGQLTGAPELAQSLQVNFLTMDRIPQSGTSKFWDALGDGRDPSQVNTPITIPLNRSGVYDNRTAVDLEPEGDVADPDLDIVDWSVEVRRQ